MVPIDRSNLNVIFNVDTVDTGQKNTSLLHEIIKSTTLETGKVSPKGLIVSSRT